ncbi:MAG: hypothetical protein AAFP90_07045 [Planctomycetota bacterium]
MDPIVYSAIIGAACGIGCGLIPFFLGVKNDRFILGGLGLACCGAAGCVLGLLAAVPTAVAFSLALRR